MSVFQVYSLPAASGSDLAVNGIAIGFILYQSYNIIDNQNQPTKINP